MNLISFILHIDTHLAVFLAEYGTLTYGLLFLIVICETGLVVTPFLPGDSLLFAAGAFAGKGLLDPWLLFGLLFVAAVLGDTLNFAVGHYLGDTVYNWNSRWIKREHLEKTRGFFLHHGGKTIVIARFMPIIRTFAPFVAGVGRMNYSEFLGYNVLGGFLWVSLFIWGGYFFGSIPFVEENFSVVILIIIALSILPAVIGWLKSRKVPTT
jgi:membrane-associated protein